MKRETLIAIGVGILFGCGVAVFVLFQTDKNEDAKVIPVEPAEVAQTQPKQVVTTQKQLTVETPFDQAVIQKKTVTIKGIAEQKSLIMIQSPTGEQVISSEDGTFSADFPLSLGENIIHISVYAGSSAPQERTLRVYYVPEE